VGSSGSQYACSRRRNDRIGYADVVWPVRDTIQRSVHDGREMRRKRYPPNSETITNIVQTYLPITAILFGRFASEFAFNVTDGAQANPAREFRRAKHFSWTIPIISIDDEMVYTFYFSRARVQNTNLRSRYRCGDIYTRLVLYRKRAQTCECVPNMFVVDDFKNELLISFRGNLFSPKGPNTFRTLFVLPERFWTFPITVGRFVDSARLYGRLGSLVFVWRGKEQNWTWEWAKFWGELKTDELWNFGVYV